MNTQLNPALYRRALGTFCSGLTIVTGYDTGPVGFSCQSFSAISLDPPLIMISPGRSSRTWPRIREVGSCCINVLADNQATLCRSFAVSGAEKFCGVDWRLSTWGSPEIAGCLAWLHCEIEQEIDAGDHTIVLCRLRDVDLPDDDTRAPLLFHRSRFSTLATRN